MRQSVLACALTAALAIGCGVEPGCDICTSSVIVTGNVVSTQGPLVGARVRALPYAGECADSIQAGDSSAAATTSATGTFTLRVSTILTSGRHCVVFRVAVAHLGSWRDTLMAVSGIQFGSDYPSMSHATTTVYLTLAGP